MTQDINLVGALSRRRGIQSVEIGLRVLEALAGLGEPATLKAVAQASGVSASQAHRYLSSLIASGMAQQEAMSGRYDLGPSALKLGLGALARIDAFKITDQEIADFVQRTSRTVQIAALGPMGPTIIRWYMGKPAVMTSFNVGSVLPLLYSATGQVFLTFAAEAETEALLTRELVNSKMTKRQVSALCARVRSEGKAVVTGSMIPGLHATAYPIFDIQGRPILCATALWSDISEYAGPVAGSQDLQATCQRISERLGYIGAAAK